MSLDLSGLEKTYNIEKEIGRGGMGVVYLATDKRLERPVAIKVLNISPESAGNVSVEEVLERFQREAKAVAKLSHPNIVNIHDIGQEGDLYYMVMEFVDGNVLSNFVEENISPGIIVNIAIQVCNALDFAHHHKIIHRDIKPANIILSKSGIAKLMDFGIAQLNKEESKLTQAGSVLGSIMYISPEQLDNASSVDARADIYSFGVSIYELLTGRLPFEDDTISKIVMKILTQTAPPPSVYNPNIPTELDLIILKALEKDVNQRYQTAGEFGRDLTLLLNNHPSLSQNQQISSLFGNSGNSAFSTPTIVMNSQNTTIQNQGLNDSTVIMNKESLDLDQTNIMNKQDLNLDQTIVMNKESLPNPNQTIAHNINRPSAAKSTVLSGTLLYQELGKPFADNSFIKLLETNYSWIETYVENWETEKLEDIDLQGVIDKVTERTSEDINFTGVVIIDEHYYLFVYDSYFIGAINIYDNTLGENVFEILPDEPDSVELKIPHNNNKYSIPIISGILGSNEPFHTNLDSNTVDLLPLVKNFSEGQELFTGFVKCYSETNIYYYGYVLGQNIFSSAVTSEDTAVPEEIYSDIEKLVKIPGIQFNSYTVNPELIGTSIYKIFKHSEVFMTYRDNAKADLYEVLELGSEEIPTYLVKETKNNVKLELKLNRPGKLVILDKHIDLTKVVKDSIYYKFTEWLIFDYFYELNSSGNTVSMKQIYTLIPSIEEIKFYETIKGENGKYYEFSVAFYGTPKNENDKKLLFVAKVNDGDLVELEKFMEESIELKKRFIKSVDVAATFYIASRDYTSESLSYFSEKTVEPKKGLFSSFDASAKLKGFIKLAYGKGFQMNLIQHQIKYDDENEKEIETFKVIEPKL